MDRVRSGLSRFRLEACHATLVQMDPEDVALLAEAPSGVLTSRKEDDYY